ncbi:MAG: hypothetical protein ACOX5Z_06790 [Desulfobulbus sp.]|jgi:hypothetical protein
MRINVLTRFGIFLGIMLLLVAACGNEESAASKKSADEPTLGPYGPKLGDMAHVVRSVIVKTSGDVTGEFSGAKGEEGTYLVGLCNPTSFANFGIVVPGGEAWDKVTVTIYSKGPIGTAETGTFKLEWVEAAFSKIDGDKTAYRRFKNPGTITLTTHDATPNARRMIGTMEGRDLEEITTMGELTGKTVDLDVSFDMDFSCGIAQ